MTFKQRFKKKKKRGNKRPLATAEKSDREKSEKGKQNTSEQEGDVPGTRVTDLGVRVLGKCPVIRGLLSHRHSIKI